MFGYKLSLDMCECTEECEVRLAIGYPPSGGGDLASVCETDGLCG